MDIADMHVNFRQYAQQMGMQNVRAILPEQIDIVLNTSITDTVNQLLREHIGVTNDRVITDNSKIGQINALRTLYKVDEVNITIGNNFTYDSTRRLSGLIKHTGTQQANISDTVFGNPMFLIDISINYQNTTDNIITNWYPVRIIDDVFLADTLNDFILKNRWRSPIATVYKNFTTELYIDKFKAGNAPIVEVVGGKSINLVPNQLRISTIQYPAKVKFVEDISEGQSVNCDLPESMHEDIVKHAVDLYRVAVNGSLQATQEAEQAQQRENVRNNYRNDGNQ